jgi:hypothetical protein
MYGYVKLAREILKKCPLGRPGSGWKVMDH